MAATIFLGKLLGLYLVAISIAMLVDGRRTLATIDEMARSGAWLLFSGLVATGVGLTVAPAHNVWSGGVLSVMVTLFGWAALLKGLTLLLFPAERIASAYKGIGFDRYFHIWMVVVLRVGLWTTYLAFTN